MIPDQGELAVEVSYDSGHLVLHHYKLPKNNHTFGEEELKELWVEASRRNFGEKEPEVTEVLDSFFATKNDGINSGQTVHPTSDSNDRGTVPVKTLSQMHNEIKNTLRPKMAPEQKKRQEQESASVYAGKKYKPVDKKVRPILAELPAEFRIERNITGNPLENLPELSTHPKEFVPTGRYTQERKEIGRKHSNVSYVQATRLGKTQIVVHTKEARQRTTATM